MEIKALLLDTSAYSAFMRGDPDIKLALQQVDEIYLSPIVLGELMSGFQKDKYRKKNEQELAAFLSSRESEHSKSTTARRGAML